MDYLFAPERYVSDRFILRGYHPGDGPLLREATTSSYEHLKRFLPWARPEQSEEAAEQTVRTFRARYLLAEDFVIGIFSPDERQLLGGTGFHLREGGLHHRGAEIGMWVRASHAGQGLGTAALKAMLQWGFTEWPWERLSWRCRESNLASRRTAEKAGMQLEGVLRARDLLPDGTREAVFCYGGLRDGWREMEQK